MKNSKVYANLIEKLIVAKEAIVEANSQLADLQLELEEMEKLSNK